MRTPTSDRVIIASRASRMGGGRSELCLRLRLPSWMSTLTSMGIPCSLSRMFSCGMTDNSTCSITTHNATVLRSEWILWWLQRVSTWMASWRLKHSLAPLLFMTMVPLDSYMLPESGKVALELKPLILWSTSACRLYTTARWNRISELAWERSSSNERWKKTIFCIVFSLKHYKDEIEL